MWSGFVTSAVARTFPLAASTATTSSVSEQVAGKSEGKTIEAFGFGGGGAGGAGAGGGGGQRGGPPPGFGPGTFLGPAVNYMIGRGAFCAFALLTWLCLAIIAVSGLRKHFAPGSPDGA